MGTRRSRQATNGGSAELSARIDAATYDLLVLIREFDQQEGWSGCLSCAKWLTWRTGLAPGAAREHVRVARALGELPKLSDAMRGGRISYSKVRAVTRVATSENEQSVLDVALAGTAEHVERIVRGWRRVDRAAEEAEEEQRDASRSLRTWVDDDGMVLVRGRLTPEVGAVLRRALDAACDEARRAPASDGGEEAAAAAAATGGDDQPTLAQRQADAIAVVAEAALAGGLDKGTAGDRYQVVLHVDAAALVERQDVSRTNVGRRAGRVRAARARRRRSRRNARDDERRADRFPRRDAAHCRSTTPRIAQPCPSVAPDGRPVSGRAPRVVRRRRTCRAASRQPDRARRSGWHPRLRGDRPARCVRRRQGHDAPRAINPGEWQHVATIHGWVDDMDVCIEIVEFLEEEEPGRYACRYVNAATRGTP